MRPTSLVSTVVATGVAVLVGCSQPVPAAAPATAPPTTVAASSPAAPSPASSVVAAPSASPAIPSPAAVASAPQNLVSIRATYSNLVATELPLWLAKEEGLFAKHGLDVDLRLAESGVGMPALLSGEVQIIDIAVPQTLSAAAGGARVVDVAENAPKYPYVLQVAPEIKTAQDLKGKKVGISSPGSASDIATRVGLRKIGLDPDKDVSIVAVGSASARVAAMQNGAIQAAMAVPPDTLLLLDKGFTSLYDLSSENLPTGNATQVVTREYLDAHRDVVQKWIDTDVEAIALAKRDKAKAISVLKQYFKSADDRAMNVAYDYVIQQIIPSLPYPETDQYTDSQTILGASNPSIKNVDVTSILDRSLVQSAADRKVGE